MSNKDWRVEGRPRGSALLVVKRGPNAGSGSWLDQPVTSAGRRRQRHRLDDITVSEHHAEFRRENRKFQVVDVDSFLTTSTTWPDTARPGSLRPRDGRQSIAAQRRCPCLILAMPKCTAPVKGHHSAAARADCPACGAHVRSIHGQSPTYASALAHRAARPQRGQPVQTLDGGCPKRAPTRLSGRGGLHCLNTVGAHSPRPLLADAPWGRSPSACRPRSPHIGLINVQHGSTTALPVAGVHAQDSCGAATTTAG